MIKIHNLNFNTDNQNLVWERYYSLKNKEKYKKYKGTDKMVRVLKDISIDFNGSGIEKPLTYSKFEIQASLWFVLRNNYSLDVRGDVGLFDLVVFNKDEAVCLININKQKSKKNRKHKLKEFYCMDMSEVDLVAREICDYCNVLLSDKDRVSRLFANV